MFKYRSFKYTFEVDTFENVMTQLGIKKAGTKN